jgi:hypothetical protein
MSCWQQSVVIHPQLDCPIFCTRSRAAASMRGGINCCAIELLQGSNPSTSGACCLLTAWSPAACKCSQDALGARTGFLNNAEVRLPTHFCGVCPLSCCLVIHMSPGYTCVAWLYVCRMSPGYTYVLQRKMGVRVSFWCAGMTRSANPGRVGFNPTD